MFCKDLKTLQQKQQLSPYIINPLVVIAGKEHVYCAVRRESLNIILVSFRLYRAANAFSLASQVMTSSEKMALDNKLGRIWKEAVLACFKVLSQQLFWRD